MARPAKIDPADKDFCRAVATAAFTNPFSTSFRELTESIVGHELSPALRQEAFARAIVARADKFTEAGCGDLTSFTGADREIMRRFFLYEVYQRFYQELDALVVEQERAGDTSLKVRFAREAIAQLEMRGFERAEAVRVFAIFYQIRRAHHFIVRGLPGRSACMLNFRRHLWTSVFTHDIGWYERRLWNRMEDFSTLLLGETGTGKGTAAAALGRSGFIPYDDYRGTFTESFAASFISLNLSQFPETLIESELFGHRKGAFTGAMEAHQGIFARCSPHGAIFLDEIGDVSPPVQIKLLQILQERVFTPVGSHERLRFNGRVIAATHRPIHELRTHGIFREDFYYRLCSDTIIVPSLRERFRDDPLEREDLLEHVLLRTVGAPEPELAELVRRALRESVGQSYDWPGNVREFEQAIRRILITQRYVPERATEPAGEMDRLLAQVKDGAIDASQLLAGYCRLLYSRSRNLEAVARITRLDRRTVKRHLGFTTEQPSPETRVH